jgi:predicted hydrocarbon binding protein
MYGLVNAAFRDMIVSNFGVDKWELIRLAVVPELEEFARMQPYSDAITYQMVQEGCAVTGISQEDLLVKFGEFWVTYTASEGYSALFDIAGDSLADFLLSLNELHVRVGRNFPKLRPPEFRFDVIDRNTLHMHYLTRREGLCPFVRGLLQGLSLRFRTPLSVQTLACRALGADHCEFLLKLGEKVS